MESWTVCVILFCCRKVIWEYNGPKQFELLEQYEEETTYWSYNATRYPGYFFFF